MHDKIHSWLPDVVSTHSPTDRTKGSATRARSDVAAHGNCLLQVAYFVGCLLGVLMSVLFLEKLNRKHTTLVLLFLCACSTAAFGVWNDILAIIG